MKKLLSIITVLTFSLGFGSLVSAQSTGNTKVVYHIDGADFTP